MPATTSASLLALIGIFDIVGTVASGWLTDRVDSRYLLCGYYFFRGLSLLAVPYLLGPDVRPSLFVFIVFYGLDWVATVPPTVALCRQHFGIERAGVVFGWVFAAHMVGAGVAASFAGWIRTTQGDYFSAWITAGGLCVAAAAMCLTHPGEVATSTRLRSTPGDPESLADRCLLPPSVSAGAQSRVPCGRSGVLSSRGRERSRGRECFRGVGQPVQVRASWAVVRLWWRLGVVRGGGGAGVAGAAGGVGGRRCRRAGGSEHGVDRPGGWVWCGGAAVRRRRRRVWSGWRAVGVAGRFGEGGLPVGVAGGSYAGVDAVAGSGL